MFDPHAVRPCAERPADTFSETDRARPELPPQPLSPAALRSQADERVTTQWASHPTAIDASPQPGLATSTPGDCRVGQLTKLSTAPRGIAKRRPAATAEMCARGATASDRDCADALRVRGWEVSLDSRPHVTTQQLGRRREVARPHQELVHSHRGFASLPDRPHNQRLPAP